MAVRYLLDTNTASYIIKGNLPRVRERLMAVAVHEVGISVVTEAELRLGAARLTGAERLARAVEEFLLRLEILPWDSQAAKHYAELRAEFETKGETLGNLDLMIAAHALATKTVLVTSDRVFRRVNRLAVEDWSRA